MPQGEYLQYGGQAIFEGVMMRSPKFFSVACRAPNGEIVTQTEALEKTWIGRQKWLKLALSPRLPSLAGRDGAWDQSDEVRLECAACAGVSEARIGGWSTDRGQQSKIHNPKSTIPGGQQERPGRRRRRRDVHWHRDGAPPVCVFLPNWIAEGLGRFGVTEPIQKNLASGIIKIVFFLGYLALIGMMEAVKDVFRYHGAEHKAINTLEAEQELNLENCRRQTRLHPRCGTSFAVIVLIISLFLFTFVPRYPLGEHSLGLLNVLIRVGLEMIILPPIAGIAYELLRLAGKFRNQTLVNLAFKPGIWTQYLTTREPNEGQIEVALIALKNVLSAEKTGAVVEPHEDALESAPIPIP